MQVVTEKDEDLLILKSAFDVCMSNDDSS